MPGMILIILQQTLLIGIGMIGGAGKERRNNQVVQPGVKVREGMFSVVLGKGFAYFTIYLANLAYTLVYLSKWFDFPDKGSFADGLYFAGALSFFGNLPWTNDLDVVSPARTFNHVTGLYLSYCILP